MWLIAHLTITYNKSAIRNDWLGGLSSQLYFELNKFIYVNHFGYNFLFGLCYSTTHWAMIQGGKTGIWQVEFFFIMTFPGNLPKRSDANSTPSNDITS